MLPERTRPHRRGRHPRKERKKRLHKQIDERKTNGPTDALLSLYFLAFFVCVRLGGEMQVGRKKLTFFRILDPRMDVNKAHKFACLMTL